MTPFSSSRVLIWSKRDEIYGSGLSLGGRLAEPISISKKSVMFFREKDSYLLSALCAGCLIGRLCCRSKNAVMQSECKED